MHLFPLPFFPEGLMIIIIFHVTHAPRVYITQSSRKNWTTPAFLSTCMHHHSLNRLFLCPRRNALNSKSFLGHILNKKHKATLERSNDSSPIFTWPQSIFSTHFFIMRSMISLESEKKRDENEWKKEQSTIFVSFVPDEVIAIGVQ